MTKKTKMNAGIKTVLKAAAACFAEKGVRKTTMQMVADEAGIALTELKALFKTKNHLAMSVQSQELSQLQTAYIQSMPDAAVDEMIKHIIRMRCEFVETHQEQTTLFFQNAFVGREPWSAMLDKMIWQLSVEFATLFEKSVRSGFIRKDADINVAVRAITSFYLTGIVTVGLRAKVFHADEVWAFIEPQIDMVIEGLKA